MAVTELTSRSISPMPMANTMGLSGLPVRRVNTTSIYATGLRGSGLNQAEYDGLTGASVTSGRTLNVTLELEDALIDAGYQVRVDTAVEDMRDNRSDVVAPLTTEGSGKSVSGRGYVQSFVYELK